MSGFRSRPVSFQQLGLIKQSDRIDTRVMLLIADVADRIGSYDDDQLVEILRIPVQSNVSAKERLAEARAVVEFWDSGFLQAALEFDAPWHALVEAAKDENLRTDPRLSEHFFTQLEDFLLKQHKWPKVGTLRQWRGRPSNHREKGDVEGQESLAV